MTISGTMLSAFLITLGTLLGAFAWGGYFERPATPQPTIAVRPDLARALSSEHPKRLAAADPARDVGGSSTGILPVRAPEEPGRLRATSAASAPPSPPKSAKASPIKASAALPPKQASAKPPKDKRQPQQAGLQWPWSFFGK